MMHVVFSCRGRNYILFAYSLLLARHTYTTMIQSFKVYKFVGVNVSHSEFIKRYGRLGPEKLSRSAGQGDQEVDAMTCTKLADHLLVRNRHDPDSKSKYEVGKTKVFIRCVVLEIRPRPSVPAFCRSVLGMPWPFCAVRTTRILLPTIT